MPTRRSPADWGLFLVLSLFWSSAFAMTKVAVDGLPASLIIPCRLATAAAILWAVMLARGERLPPFSDRASWLAILGMGSAGTAVPFYLITLGQETIDSSLAALIIAASPLFAACLAHWRFGDERMTPQKVAGLAVGFSGVAVLLGPDALNGLGSANIAAQMLVLAGAFCYALNSIIARGAPRMAPTVLPAGFLTVASVLSLPMLAFTDWQAVQPGPANVLAVVLLGTIPTAAAGILLMFLVQRTSATFIALTGYVIPVMSAVIGYLAFGETQSWMALLAFALILGGVWLSQRREKPPLKA